MHISLNEMRSKMQQLPRDLLYHLLTFLDAIDHLALTSTCRRLRIDLACYLRYRVGMSSSDAKAVVRRHSRMSILSRLLDLFVARTVLDTYRQLNHPRVTFLFLHAQRRVAVTAGLALITIQQGDRPRRTDEKLEDVIYALALGRGSGGDLPSPVQLRLILS